MIEGINLLISIFIGCIVFIYYTNALFKPRTKYLYANISIIVGYMMLYAISSFYQPTLNVIAFSIATFVLMYLCFKVTLKNAIIQAFMLTAIMMLAVVLGIIAFLLLEMIIRKNFKIFSKALFKEIIAFGAFVVVVFGGITVYGNVQENYIPKLADIDSARIAIDFDINLEGKDVEKILETQKILMAQKKDYFKKRYDDSGYITISYTLKNGEKVNRVYHTTDDFNPHKQCKAIMAEENKPQNIINAIMQCDTTDITFINGSAEQYNDKYVDVLNERFNGKVAADIFDAVKKDVEAGVMQEYNLQRMLDGVDKDTSYMYNLMLNFTVPKGNRIGKSWNVDGFTWYEELLDILGVTKEYSDFGDARSDGIETYSVNISFGENCTNLIAVLKENGLISSKEPLLTYE